MTSSRPRSAAGSPCLGPLENADQVGTDLTLAIHDMVLPAIENRPGPSPYLQELVADGKLGFKSGEGFRKWSPEEQAALRSQGDAAPQGDARDVTKTLPLVGREGGGPEGSRNRRRRASPPDPHP